MENWLVEVYRHILQLPDMVHEYIHHWVKDWCERFKFYSRRPYIVLDTHVTSGDGLESNRVN